MGDVAGDDERAGQRQPRLDRVPRQLGEDLAHRLGEVDLHDLAALDEVLFGGVRQVLDRVGLELLEEHALRRDLAQRLPVGRAGDGDGHRAGRAVPGEPDDADVVAEVLAAELGADAEGLGELEDFFLQLQVTEAVRAHRALGGQIVEVVRRGVLRRLERELRRRAADDDGQVIRRAGRGAERADLLVEELQ